MASSREKGVPYAWHDPEPLPDEPALAPPVQPYVDELHIPPMIQPAPGADGARLRIWMLPARAQLHSDLANLTDVWVYRASAALPDGPQPPVGPTIEVQQGQRVHVDWVNALRQHDGTFARHPVVPVRDLPAYVQLEGGGDVYAAENLLGFTGGRLDQSVAEAIRQQNPVERLLALVEDDQGMLQLQACAPLRDDQR